MPVILEVYQGASASHPANHRRYEGPDQADGRHGQQRTCIRRRPSSRRRRHFIGAERTLDVTELAVSDIIKHQVVEGHDFDEGLHPAERHLTPTTFDYYGLQPDDEPFHGNVTKDDISGVV